MVSRAQVVSSHGTIDIEVMQVAAFDFLLQPVRKALLRRRRQMATGVPPLAGRVAS
jgi:hypothetical protein